MTETIDTTIDGLPGAKEHLNQLTEIHNKLQNEKSRLQAAVTACEAATAAVSRPSSPQDAIAYSIPERELAVRVRPEDWIDQSLFKSEVNAARIDRLVQDEVRTIDRLHRLHEKVQNHTAAVNTTIKELEGMESSRDLLSNWI